MSENIHIPVLKDEVVEFLNVREGKRYLDGTIGCGGHTIAMLDKAKGNIEVLGVDRDREILEIARKNIEKRGYLSRVCLHHARFSQVFEIMDEMGWRNLDGVLLDLGISSYQVDNAKRGFSFHHDGPLDMRMDRDEDLSAFELINSLGYEELKSIIWEYGEEKMAPRIARKIVEKRREDPIRTTLELASIIMEAYPPKWRRTSKRHPATRTFQAIRIAVNEELKELTEFLNRILDVLNKGARIVIISFHSLEDRIVKHFFKREQKGCLCPSGQFICTCNHTPRLRILTKKPVVPDEEEIEVNKRARSAKLRAAEVI